MQYSRGQKGRGEDKLWRCSGERMRAGTQRGHGQRAEREGTEGQMNMQSRPRVLFLLPSDSTNHPQMMRDGREENRRDRK